MKHSYINKLLYEARLAKKWDRKTASKFLNIWTFQLKLIEKGYFPVPKSRQQRFIEVYNLRSNFFSANSNYIADIDKTTDQAKQNGKTKKFFAKKAVRWTALGLTIANVGMAGFGIYALNRQNISPTVAWSNDFKEFWTNLKQKGNQSPSVVYPGDIKYSIRESNVSTYDDGYCDISIATFGKEINADDTQLDAWYNMTSDNKEHPIVTKDSYFSYSVVVYNKKKIIYSSFANRKFFPTFTISDALGVLDNDNKLTFKPFYYYQDGIEHIAEPGKGVFEEFSSIFNYYLIRAYSNFNLLFNKHQLKYQRVQDLIKDLGVISRDRILYFRMGLWFTILGAVFGVGFAFVLALSFYFYYQHKKKGTYVANYKSLVQPPKPVFKIARFQKDLNIRLIIPEFVLTIIALVILALSQVATYLSITYFFRWANTFNPEPLRNFSNNFLIVGIMLLFFISLDKNTKKTLRQLLISIIACIFGGLAFYVAEVVMFTAFTTQTNIFSIVFKFLSTLLPGNFIWPLALYSSLFLFLFYTPNKYRNNAKALKRFRLLSLMPTALLLFSLIWQFSLKNIVNAPYYIQFLFFSKGTTITLFFLIYVFALYFFQRICRKEFGYVTAQTTFFNSKRYYFSKNCIAAITLILLLIVELCFRFLYPTNNYGLGKNWAIGIMIPFILFYHPHIGVRNAKWDTISLILKAIFTFCGFAAAIFEVLTYLNFGQVLFIIS